MQAQTVDDATTNSRLRVLDAGEEAFSAFGFDGASMRVIATSAGVSQSLLHYHFGTKAALYRGVIERRAQSINAERLRRLKKVDVAAADGLEQIFRALLGPPLEPLGGGMSYARIFAGVVAGGAREVALVREFYDDTARAFIDALVEACPGVSRLNATRAYSMAIGVLAISLTGDERNARLAGSVPTKDRDELLTNIVTYVCGGFHALTKKPE